MAITSSSNRRDGSRTASAASACTGDRVGHHADPDARRRGPPRPRPAATAVHVACRWAAATTWPAPVARIACSSSAVDGSCVVGPPPSPRPSRPRRAKSVGEPGAARDHHHRRPRAAASDGAAGRRLAGASAIWSAKRVTEIRCGRPASDPGLDRRADVVDVDVHVPGGEPPRRRRCRPRPASRPARRAPPSATPPPPSVASSRYCTSYSYSDEPVSRGDGRARAGSARRSRAGRRRGGLPGDHLDQGVEQHDQPAAAGVDHAGPGQHRQLLGRAGQRLGRRPRRRLRPPWRGRRCRRRAPPPRPRRPRESTVPSTGSATAA